MSQQAGSSLIEIVISIFLLSFMVLGLETMQLTALRIAKENYFFALGMQQILNGIALNLDELNTWKEKNQTLLPNGLGEKLDHKITISWGGVSLLCPKNKIGLSGCLSLSI